MKVVDRAEIFDKGERHTGTILNKPLQCIGGAFLTMAVQFTACLDQVFVQL